MKDVTGKTVLVGITYLDRAGNVKEQVQAHGRVIAAGDTIELETDSGERLTLPPELEPAEPGEYRLRSTGEVVVDPDYIATWTVTPPGE